MMKTKKEAMLITMSSVSTIAVHDESNGLLRGDATLVAVEQLVLGYF